MNLFFEIATVPLTEPNYRFDLPDMVDGKYTPEEFIKLNTDQILEYVNTMGVHILIDDPEWMAKLTTLVESHEKRDHIYDAITEANDKYESWVETHSRVPELSKVISIAVSINGAKPSGAVVGEIVDGKEKTEADLVSRFWQIYSESSRIIGWGIGSRLAFILTSSVRHGIASMMQNAPAVLGQPWKAQDSGAIVDMYKFRYFQYPRWEGAMPMYYQNPVALCQAMNGEKLTPPISSTSYYAMYRNKDHAGVLEATIKQLLSTVCLAKKWQGNYLPFFGLKGE